MTVLKYMTAYGTISIVDSPSARKHLDRLGEDYDIEEVEIEPEFVEAFEKAWRKYSDAA